MSNEEKTIVTKSDTSHLETLDEALNKLYDYEYVNIEKFYNYKETQEAFDRIEASKCPVVKEEVAKDLLEDLQSFLNFETNYCVKIGDL